MNGVTEFVHQRADLATDIDSNGIVLNNIEL